MSAIVKHLEIEEAIKALHLLSNYAFTPTPPLPDYEAYAERIRNRHGADYFAVLQDGEPLAICCSTTPLIQNIRGELYAMGGVANVATHPAARRKGYARMLMQNLFEFFKDKNWAVSCLYPFKETFYQRLGYVTLPQTKIISFNPTCLTTLLKQSLTGEIKLVRFQEGYASYLSFLKKHQKSSHGMALFSRPQPELAEKHESWLAFAMLNDQIIGMMNYKLSGQEMHQTMWADDFLFDNAHGKYLLLNWIARHLDQVEKVELTLKPDLIGEILFTDLRPDYRGRFLAPMARIIDLMALNGLPIGPGETIMRISDPNCPWNAGIWRFSSIEGQLSIQNDDRQPDFEISIHGINALVYGVYDPDEFMFRKWGNPNPDQQKILRKMFPPVIPFVHAKY